MIIEGTERGVGYEPLIQEFVDEVYGLDDVSRQNRTTSIAGYYSEILRRTHSVRAAYYKTRDWAMNTYVRRYLNPVERVCESMDDKEQYFIDRTTMHRNLVQKAIGILVTANPEFYHDFDGNELIERGKIHDQSKFEEPERTPYVELTWKHKLDNFGGYKTPGTIPDEKINQATIHHITTNAHHPEFHNKQEANIDPNNRDKSVKCIDASKMTGLDVAEMVADWQAMSWELKKNTPREWFNRQRDVRWHFSDEQVNLIDRLLGVLEDSETQLDSDETKIIGKVLGVK